MGAPSYYEMNGEPTAEDIKKVVQGFFTPLVPSQYRHYAIHPLFTSEEGSDGFMAWRMVDNIFMSEIKKTNTARFWCNENGYYDCMPNMAVVDFKSKQTAFGEILIVIKRSKMNKICDDWRENIRKVNNVDELIDDSYMEE